MREPSPRPDDVAGRLDVAPQRETPRPDMERLRSLCALALRLAREDIEAERRESELRQVG